MPASKPSNSGEVPELQDRSIKERKYQLFDEPDVGVSTTLKPFSEYVKETPPTSLSPGLKGALFGAAVVVVFLFLAAMFSLVGSKGERKPEALRAPARTDRTVRATGAPQLHHSDAHTSTTGWKRSANHG